ncbi:hypothetical protein RsTz2092_00790 [Deferribacterales bacterium RsTz2092]|nr:hypothetical protein AGMMS49941_00690 [Deferribacterales bacterium]
MSFSENIKEFVDDLSTWHSEDVFNPWGESDKENDIGSDAPRKRRSNLINYLQQREKAKIILVAEALGYQGGHFSGIAMTSERDFIRYTDKVFAKENFHRTSDKNKTDVKNRIKDGWTEPTGTVVWKTMLEYLSPTDWINWNAFAFHPHKHNEILTNRTPSDKELLDAQKYLSRFLEFFPNAKVLVAIGNKAKLQLEELGRKPECVRHPANGGKPEFVEYIKGKFK